jgi:2-succinyl-6-hydroxy-2,4-cyclohexadiene-1-carboxylate synthase
MRCALIHGFGGSPAAWDDVIDAWQLPEPPLAIALPGHGGGPVLPTCVNPGIQDAERDQRREFDAAWARMLRTEGVAVFHDAWTKQPLFATQQRVAPDKLAERRARRVALDAEQLARSLEVMGLAGMPDYWPAVSAHRDRIALLAGADDAKYVALSASLPCAYFEQIPNSGHDPTLENPRDLAAAIARAVAKLR